jgi:hypothetical protein
MWNDSPDYWTTAIKFAMGSARTPPTWHATIDKMWSAVHRGVYPQCLIQLVARGTYWRAPHTLILWAGPPQMARPIYYLVVPGVYPPHTSINISLSILPVLATCNTLGVCHQLSSGFELKHDMLSGDEGVKFKPVKMSPNLNLDHAPLLTCWPFSKCMPK